MVIVDLTKIEKSFGDLRTGTVFKREYEEGSKSDYCIKVPEVLDQRSQEKFNAIDLEDGSWCQFDNYERVIPYDATLQLEQ